MFVKWIVLGIAIGCSGSTHPPTVEPAISASTDCYAGVSTGMGQHARTIARRTVDPVAKTITEDASHDAAGAHGANSFHVVMAVTDNAFTLSEASGAFTGTGVLVGEPWQWTSWSSVSAIANTTITVESHDELTSAGLHATKQIKQAGKLIGTTTDDLKAFDGAQWDDARAALAVPTLDRSACDRACRNFATLKFWQHAEAEISALPEDAQDSAHAMKSDQLAKKLEEGLEGCISTCLGANNAQQTGCWGDAKSVDELAACDLK